MLIFDLNSTRVLNLSRQENREFLEFSHGKTPVLTFSIGLQFDKNKYLISNTERTTFEYYLEATPCVCVCVSR